MEKSQRELTASKKKTDEKPSFFLGDK